MTFAREKRLALGWLALLAPLPLPFNEPRPEGVVSIGFLGLYLAAVSWFLVRASRDETSWLRPMALNLLGLVYLPFLALDVALLYDGHLVRPMMRLALFALVAKLFSLKQEKDKWQALVGIFFVFVTAMATSASFGIIFYLVLFSAFAVRTLGAFASLHVQALSGEPVRSARGGLSLRTTAALAVGVAVLSVPLFVLLPRLRNPYILGSGSQRSLEFSTGFNDDVSLDSIGRIRSNPEVALRMEVLEGVLPTELRLRGAAYDTYRESRWFRSGGERALNGRGRTPSVRLADEPVATRVAMWLQPIGTSFVILPIEAVRITFPGRPPPLSRSSAGAVSLPYAPNVVVEYEVGMARDPMIAGQDPPGSEHPTRDLSNVSIRVSSLARSVAVGESDYQKAREIERYLMRSYGYSLDLIGRVRGDPIEDFLFERRQGHCEYFATAMVQMLRSVGIPARFVTGFLGAEQSPLGYEIVRQSNAHAWVEAYIPERGWLTFDPTPPAGRPGLATTSWAALVRQAYDYLVFRWDRYVISFGQGDQARFIGALKDRWNGLFRSEPDRPSRPPVELLPPDSSTVQSGGAVSWLRRLMVPLVLLALSLVLAVVWMWRRRARLDAVVAYQRLRGLAQRHGVVLDEATAPRDLERRIARRFPEASEASGELVQLYLHESFSPRELSDDDRERLGELLDQASLAMREQERSLKKAS